MPRLALPKTTPPSTQDAQLAFEIGHTSTATPVGILQMGNPGLQPSSIVTIPEHKDWGEKANNYSTVELNNNLVLSCPGNLAAGDCFLFFKADGTAGQVIDISEKQIGMAAFFFSSGKDFETAIPDSGNGVSAPETSDALQDPKVTSGNDTFTIKGSIKTGP